MPCLEYDYRVRSCAAHGRRVFAVAVPFLLACDPAPPDIPDPDTGVQLTTVRVTPGDTIAVFPPPGSPLLLESVRAMALAEDGRSVHVLDAHTVHHLDMDGNLLGSMGGEGEGPGELKRPWRIQPATGGGAWVLDSGNGRATLYGHGSTVEDQITGIDRAGAPFVPYREGILLTDVPMPVVSVSGRNVVSTPGEPNRERLLSYHCGSGEMLEVESPPEVPAAFVQSEWGSREMGWSIAAVSRNEIAIVVSGRDLSAWRLVLGDDAHRIDSITELPVPADVRRLVREAAEFAGPDMFAVTIRLARVVDGRLWAVAGGLGPWPGKPLTITIPLDGGTTSLRLDREPLDPELDVVDAIVLPDRLIVATQIEVLFLSVARE
ncbi:MAG: hypothetical protein F4187_03905 [Gemmatimonadetes bacterium]|nr:hypothetical protein [Gemmatimonadota bacterium]